MHSGSRIQQMYEGNQPLILSQETRERNKQTSDGVASDCQKVFEEFHILKKFSATLTWNTLSSIR